MGYSGGSRISKRRDFELMQLTIVTVEPKTYCMPGIPMLGGSEGMPSQKILKTMDIREHFQCILRHREQVSEHVLHIHRGAVV